MKRRDLVRSSSPTSVYEELLPRRRSFGTAEFQKSEEVTLQASIPSPDRFRTFLPCDQCAFFFFLISFLNLKNRMDHLDPLVDLHNKYQRPWLLLRAHLLLHVLFISSSSAFTHTLISLAKVLLGPSSVHLLGTIRSAASKTRSSLSFCPIRRTPPRHVSPPFKPASFHF